MFPLLLTRRSEATKWNLRNYNCKQIILGISHDAGYAPFLDDILRDESTRRRITVLEGYPTVRELVATGVHILAHLTDSLFRSDKLIDRTPRNPSPPGSNHTGSVTSTPIPAPATTTYARVIGNASPPPQITLPLAPKPVNASARHAVTKPPPWSPGLRGFDAPIQVLQSALDGIKKRKDSDKLCNNHYLRGPCSKGDACCFEHKYKPTPDEINAIAFLARLNPCTNGQACEVEDCIYGHHVSPSRTQKWLASFPGKRQELPRQSLLC